MKKNYWWTRGSTRSVDFCGQMGVPWTCERGTLTSFSDAGKELRPREAEKLYREKILVHVCNRGHPRSFEIADSNITNIFIRTSLEYFNARCPLSIFSFNCAVTAFNEDLPRLAGKLLWNMAMTMPSISTHMAHIPGKSLLFFVRAATSSLGFCESTFPSTRFSISFSFECVFFGQYASGSQIQLESRIFDRFFHS